MSIRLAILCIKWIHIWQQFSDETDFHSSYPCRSWHFNIHLLSWLGCRVRWPFFVVANTFLAKGSQGALEVFPRLKFSLSSYQYISYIPIASCWMHSLSYCSEKSDVVGVRQEGLELDETVSTGDYWYEHGEWGRDRCSDGQTTNIIPKQYRYTKRFSRLLATNAASCTLMRSCKLQVRVIWRIGHFKAVFRNGQSGSSLTLRDNCWAHQQVSATVENGLSVQLMIQENTSTMLWLVGLLVDDTSQSEKAPTLSECWAVFSPNSECWTVVSR